MKTLGFFKVQRRVLDSGLWQYPAAFRLFIWILSHAVFSEHEVVTGGIKVKKGQYLRSYRNLQGDLAYVDSHSIKEYALGSIKKEVYRLVRLGLISRTETEHGTLFTVMDYD